MQQTLKVKNQKWKKSSFYEEKSLVGLTPVDACGMTMVLGYTIMNEK
jgi:hypothetical protein